MKITTFSKPGSIYLTWDSTKPATIYRKIASSYEYFKMGESDEGGFEDTATQYGTAYIYKITTGYQTATSEPCWCLEDDIDYGIITDVFKGKSTGSPIFMGRAFSTHTGKLLDAQSVISASYSVSLLMRNIIVDPPQTMTIKEGTIPPEKVVTSNLALTPEWKKDVDGYNIRFQVGEVNTNLPYIVSLTLYTYKQKMTFRWLVNKSRHTR